MTEHLILIGSTLVTAWLCTPAAGWLGTRLGLVDHPDRPLKIHAHPVPRSGGLALVAALAVGQTIASVTGTGLFSTAELITVALLFGLGIWDDFRPRSAPLRMAIQIVIYAVSWYLGVRLEPFGLTTLDFAFGLVTFIVVVNAVNFYDGMDGVAALTAVAALGMWAVVASDAQLTSLPFVVAAAAVAGFLPRNWHRARIFLGDGGSFVVGFMFYLVFARAGAEASGLIPGFWVVAVPVCDAVAATLDRMFRRRGVWSGDRDHIYDILGRLGLSAGRVAVVLAIVAAILSRASAKQLGVILPAAIATTAGMYLLLVALILRLRHSYRERPY